MMCASLCARYDLDCTAEQLPPNGCQPCQCTPPAVYETVLTEHLASVMALAKQCVWRSSSDRLVLMSSSRCSPTIVLYGNRYAKPYMLMVSGSGSTQLYEECTTSTCSGAGGGPVYNATCPYTMADWMEKAVKVFDTAGLLLAKNCLRTSTNDVNGVFFSNTSQVSKTTQTLRGLGCTDGQPRTAAVSPPLCHHLQTWTFLRVPGPCCLSCCCCVDCAPNL